MNDAFPIVLRWDRTETCLHKFTRYMQLFLSSLFIRPHVRRQEARAIVEMVTPQSVQSFWPVRALCWLHETWQRLPHCLMLFLTVSKHVSSLSLTVSNWVQLRSNFESWAVEEIKQYMLNLQMWGLKWIPVIWEDAVHYTVFYSKVYVSTAV